MGYFDQILGTSLEIRSTARGRRAALGAEEAVLTEISRLERIFSLYDERSELSIWLRSRGVDVPVSPELAEVLEASEHWRRVTGGAFDPTAGTGTPPAGARGEDGPHWRLSRGERDNAASARKLSDARIDLDGIAKGYILDRACEAALADARVLGVMVNVGGDIRHRGTGEVAVAVSDPFDPAENAEPVATVSISNQSLCTSGNYRRRVQTAAGSRSHIVDPRTGRGAEGVASASVIAGTALVADALATAFSVMAPEESVALAASLEGVGCLLVLADGRSVVGGQGWGASPEGES